MQLFYQIVLASVIFTSSIVVKPAVANAVTPTVCNNSGLLKYGLDDCFPWKSIGPMSKEGCEEAGGSFYYCVVDGVEPGTCNAVQVLASGSYGGECFMDNSPTVWDCVNPGKIDSDVDYCHVDHSQGILDKADCLKADGFYYYCVTEGEKFCVPVLALRGKVTGGECFQSAN